MQKQINEMLMQKSIIGNKWRTCSIFLHRKVGKHFFGHICSKNIQYLDIVFFSSSILSIIISSIYAALHLHLISLKSSFSFITNCENISFQGIQVQYLETKPPFLIKHRGDLLYLHGAAFSSLIWNEGRPSILQMSAAAGYRTIAIDLPGK